MNNRFDDLTKNLAKSVTRRAALKKFGVGLAGMALAAFGLADKAKGATFNGYCEVVRVKLGLHGRSYWVATGACLGTNAAGYCSKTTYSGCFSGQEGPGKLGPCGYWTTKLPCSF